MINWGSVPAGAVLPFPFSTYGKTNGESITLTGLAITDVEVYKGTTVTQRSSDAGVVLIDTDGIDIDGITGIHGFTIDTGDNTDAGFYAVGSYFYVVVSAVTVDSQTVNFIAGSFRLIAAEAATGVQTVNADYVSGDQTAAANLENAYDDTAGAVPHVGIIDQGTAQSVTATTMVLRSAAAFVDDALNGATIVITNGTQAGSRAIITDYVGATDTATIAAWPGATPASTPTYKIFGSAQGAGVAQTADVATLITTVGAAGAGLTALATQASVNTIDDFIDTEIAALTTAVGVIDDFLDTEVAAILAAVDTEVASIITKVDTIDDFVDTEISALTTAVGVIDDFLDTEIAAIKTVTDKFVFTVANEVNANVQSINDAAVLGNGGGTPWGP